MEQVQVQAVEAEVEELNTEQIIDKQEVQSQLERLGFKNAVKTMDRIERMKLAYEKYMFVTPENIGIFNDKLRAETLQEDKRARRYKQLMFIPIEEYGAVPPTSVLDKLEKAQKDNIFDKFKIAKIDWKEEVKDPIIFGMIDGCEDYFYISQWDDDIKIEDLIFGK